MDTLTAVPLVDDKLPALYIVLNDPAMERILNNKIEFLHQLDLSPPISVRHTLLKYVSGKRCAIAYDLRGTSKTMPRASSQIKLIGKLYREDRGQAIYDNMSQLWHARHPIDDSSRGMSQPLLYLANLGLILQQPAKGTPLQNMLHAHNLPQAIVAAAQNLAQLHETYIPNLATRATITEHIEKYCRPHPRQMARDLSPLTTKIKALLEALLAYDNQPNAILCTVHNDLNLAHIYWHQDKTAFIDFDGICLSHAALDLANLGVALKIYLGEQGEQLAHLLLNAYMETRGITQISGLPQYEAFIYLRRATIAYRKKESPYWQNEVTQLVDQSWQALHQEVQFDVRGAVRMA